MIARDGDLEVLEERTLVELPRDREGRAFLRVRFVRGRGGSGVEVAWHDVREYFRGEDGALHPTRKGISIRGRELHAVAVAFLRACASSVPAELHAQAKAIVGALSSHATTPGPAHRQGAHHAPRELRPPPDLQPLPPDEEGIF